mmetsp:Transcript_26033/g.60007  ORF Transcript_26033/g.60007 Transcript_26033/m.60007 type:complete len:268 (-) Transcript_26033:395-1198(-)
MVSSCASLSHGVVVRVASSCAPRCRRPRRSYANSLSPDANVTAVGPERRLSLPHSVVLPFSGEFRPCKSCRIAPTCTCWYTRLTLGHRNASMSGCVVDSICIVGVRRYPLWCFLVGVLRCPLLVRLNEGALVRTRRLARPAREIRVNLAGFEFFSKKAGIVDDIRILLRVGLSDLAAVVAQHAVRAHEHLAVTELACSPRFLELIEYTCFEASLDNHVRVHFFPLPKLNCPVLLHNPLQFMKIVVSFFVPRNSPQKLQNLSLGVVGD